MNIPICFLIFLYTTITFSQSFDKSLFLIVDKKVDSVHIDENKPTKIRFTLSNEKKNWLITFSHTTIPNYTENNFVYYLPKQFISDLKNIGKVKKIEAIERIASSLNRGELSKYFKSHYSYQYEYIHKSKYEVFRKYNIFIILKEDLEKEYIPCYEVSVITSNMVTH